jgi:hypothetical protein
MIRVTAAGVLVVAMATGCVQRPQDPPLDARIERLLTEISEARLRGTIDRLTSFGTRNTLSDITSASRGIGAARQWIFDELRRSSPKLRVSFDTYEVPAQGRMVRDTQVRNVIALLPGRTSRRIYVTAHYDTVSIGPGGQHEWNLLTAGAPESPDPQLRTDQDFNTAAPGANDNGSGTALVIELARVLANSGIDFDGTLAFVMWGGEEQGLFGSKLHVGALTAETPVEAVLNSDVVGNPRGGGGRMDAASVRVYAAGPEDSPSRSLLRYVARVASLYVPGHRVRTLARTDRFRRGSDHTSFSDKGHAAVVFRESNEDFARQHGPSDTSDGVDVGYLAQNARVNAAAAAALALAPAAPRITSEGGRPLLGRTPTGYDAHLRWRPSRGAVGYRIYWRDAWSLDWQHTAAVGNLTEHVIPGLSIDDHVFGVAAVGAGGHESLIAVYQ